MYRSVMKCMVRIRCSEECGEFHLWSNDDFEDDDDDYSEDLFVDNDDYEEYEE